MTPAQYRAAKQEDEMPIDTAAIAERRGREAYRAGWSLRANPYTPHTAEWHAWREAHTDECVLWLG